MVAQADRPSEDNPAEDATGQQHPKSILSAPAESEDFDISEQERPSGSSLTANMETQNESTRGVGVASEISDLFLQPSFNPFSNDPTCWPDLYQMHSDVTLANPACQTTLGYPPVAIRLWWWGYQLLMTGSKWAAFKIQLG